MKVMQRWKQTAIHNKALVFTSVLMALGTLFYAAAATFRLWLVHESSSHTDKQIGYIIGNINWLAKTMDNSVREVGENNLKVNKNAEGAINTTKEQMRLDQRAWVVLRGIGPGPQLNQMWTLDAVFTNTGKTPAKKVAWNCVFEPAKDEHSLHWIRVQSEEPMLLAPNEQKMCILHPTSKAITQPDLDIMKSSKTRLLSVYGSATYKDIFNQWHWLTFCEEMAENMASWNSCTKGNDTGDGKNPPAPFGGPANFKGEFSIPFSIPYSP